jgi:methylamine---glutamate N-methyltransferase subunit B
MASVTPSAAMRIDLESTSIRELNRQLHALPKESRQQVDIVNPAGRHNLAVGLDAPIAVDVRGHVGYYCAGMNQRASVTVHGAAGKGAAENIMSGTVRVKGNASDCVGASGHGGLVVVEGNAASRCGISMKGVDIVVAGNVGHLSAFMAQAGRLVVCGDAGAGLGDSLYEAVLYVRGKLHGLGADAREEPMADSDRAAVADLLAKAGIAHAPGEFKRIASARQLYHWNSQHSHSY